MSEKTSKSVEATSGSLATVVVLAERRRLGTRMHGKQFSGADVLAFPLERIDDRRPRRHRDTSAITPLLDCGASPSDIRGHSRKRSPGTKDILNLSHKPEYASDELSAQAPPMIPMTVGPVIRTIRSTMGRNSTPQRLRSEMAKRLESARRVAGFETKKQAADRLGVGLDRYEKWESGRTPVPAQYVSPVCDLYGIDANYLFGTPAMRRQKETA